MHEGIILSLDEHVPGALKACRLQGFVADKGISGQYLAHPLFAQPAFNGVLPERAILARFFDVWEGGSHGVFIRIEVYCCASTFPVDKEGGVVTAYYTTYVLFLHRAGIPVARWSKY